MRLVLLFTLLACDADKDTINEEEIVSDKDGMVSWKAMVIATTMMPRHLLELKKYATASTMIAMVRLMKN